MTKKTKKTAFIGPLLANGKKGRGPKRSKRPARAGGIPLSKMVSKLPAAPRAARKPHVSAICSITDPFCVHARGAQRPDGGPPSIPYQARVVFTLIADGANGRARWVFVPNVIAYYLGCAYSAGPPEIWTSSAQWNSSGADNFPTNNARELRITSFGCVVRSAMTATTAKGLVILSTDPNPTVATVYGVGNMKAPNSQVHTLAAGMEVAWVSKPLGASAHLFRPYDDFTLTMSNFDWESLVVEVVGGDTTNSIPYLTVEYVLNMEFTVRSSVATSVAQLQRTPPVPNRVAVAGADKAHATRPSFIQGGIDAATSFLERQAKSVLDDILSDGLALLTL